MTGAPATIFWLRRDLRLDDNPALAAAAGRRAPILPLFIWAPEEEGEWPPGAATKWWLHQSLKALGADLEARGSALILRRGESLGELRRVVREIGAGAVYWNRLHDPAAVERDKRIKQALRADGLEARSFNGATLFEPGSILTGSGTPYKVFTPYWRACLGAGEPESPIGKPKKSALELPSKLRGADSLALEGLRLEPTIDWASGLREAWAPGEKGGASMLRKFVINDKIGAYESARDFPATAGTSRLSPHLHFGEIGPRRLWQAVRERFADGRRRDSKAGKSAEGWLRQLGWREFATQLLFHFPHTTDEPLRPEYAAFPWRDDRAALRAWQRGRSGYPIVDAGMRELWATGWMHNRVRMIVASFLVKDLLLPWQEGARWFWDTLVDADLANNTLGWQWAAGCGADAAPYFRIFNPVRQGEKFDPRGDYVRRWVPELAMLSDKSIQQPWALSAKELAVAGVSLGENYPALIVDHGEARKRALAALDRMKKER